MDNPLRKVIVRLKDGGVVQGFSGQDRVDRQVWMLDRQGKEKTFELDSLKAVFFVKDFEGDPDHQDLRFLDKRQKQSMAWVRLELYDGEVLEGKVANDAGLLFAPGILLWPSDKDGNNEIAFVNRSAIREFSFVGPA